MGHNKLLSGGFKFVLFDNKELKNKSVENLFLKIKS